MLPHVLPAQPRRTCGALPRHAGPNQAMPAVPCLASRDLASPRLRCHTKPRRARPYQAASRLRCRTLPCFALPSRALPAMPCHVCWPLAASDQAEQPEAQASGLLRVWTTFTNANLLPNAINQVDHIAAA